MATMATVIASQALISGAYSLTRQAVQLGFSPRVLVRHTSPSVIGQIYVPTVNWLLMVGCVGLVLGFRRSAGLAAAYGLAVSATMVITTIIFYVVARERFRWRASWFVPLFAVFLTVDLAFLGATLFKIPAGGWLPLVVAAAVFTVLSTWRTGRRLVRERTRRGLSLQDFIESLASHPPVRAPGVGAYFVAAAGVTPPALLANLRHNDSLHEQVLVITAVIEERPRVSALERAEVTDLGQGFHQVILRYGFVQDPDVPEALAGRVVMKLGIDLSTITYFPGRESLLVTARPGMTPWRERLFAVLSRNATTAARYFRLPPEQTLELGLVVDL